MPKNPQLREKGGARCRLARNLRSVFREGYLETNAYITRDGKPGVNADAAMRKEIKHYLALEKKLLSSCRKG